MPKCECCDTHPQVRDALCSTCILEGFAKAIAEQDPNLVKYDAIRSEPIPEMVLEREINEARRNGWIQ